LYNFQHRDYSPVLGRWIQADDLGFTAGDVNLYRFVGDDPTTFLDPAGLWKLKIGGDIFFIHPNDPDLLPSDPHAHMGGPNSPFKVHLGTGQVFHGGKPTGAFVPGKVLGKLRAFARGKGLLGAVIIVALATPGIVQAGQQGGIGAAGLAAGGAAVEVGVGTATSTIVGGTILTGAAAAGTSVTVGGAAVTGIVGATGVGGAAIAVGAGGYMLGNAIGQINVGGSSIHTHIGEGIYSAAPGFFNWMFGK
jgi:hypothetical protein